MKKCLLYGNCQVEPIKRCLEANPIFRSTYETLQLECFWLTQEDVPRLEGCVQSIDLFIHQPISDNYKGIYQLSTRHLKSLLRPGSIAISIPVAYFTGYNPEMVYLKDKDGNKVDGPFLLHDANILKLYAQGKTVQETMIAIQDDNFYPANYVLTNFKRTLSELQRREADIDIKISDFIKRNYQSFRLFHTINHPGSLVIAAITKAILDMIGIPPNRESLTSFCNSEVLDVLYFPIYPAIAKGLGLSFLSKPDYYFETFFRPQQAVELFFSFYDQNPDVVAYNLPLLPNVSQSETATEMNVDNCYRLLLGREPDSEGKHYWMQRIGTEMIDLEMMVKEFVGSPEFKLQHQTVDPSSMTDNRLEELVNHYCQLIRANA
ncbi:MAG TPA: WcbI family polysaccharide biosynthesis putative acetyltransferase [Crinalium sp.]|jgi:hypothetical protein